MDLAREYAVDRLCHYPATSRTSLRKTKRRMASRKSEKHFAKGGASTHEEEILFLSLWHFGIWFEKKKFRLDNSVQSLFETDQFRRDDFRFTLVSRAINRELKKVAGREGGCCPGDAPGWMYFGVDRSCRDFGEGDLRGWRRIFVETTLFQSPGFTFTAMRSVGEREKVRGGKFV